MDPISVHLVQPVEWGKETVETLEIKFQASAFKDYSLKMGADGTLYYEPYRLAQIGCQMAGRTPTFVDKLGPKDLQAVAKVVMDFLG